MKRFITSLFTVAAIAALPVVASAKPATAAAPVICQGTVAYVRGTTLGGDTRSEYQFGFGLRKNSSHEALIVGVQGTTILKPGKYLITPAGKGYSLFVSWTDRQNSYQSMTLKFSPDGTFSGSSGESTVSTPGQDMTCQLFGSQICEAATVRATTSISGVCMDPE